MKKILLLIIILAISTQTVFCATKSNPRRKSFNKMQNNNSDYYVKCSKIAEKFKFDEKFYLYLTNSCSQFEFERQKLVDTVYPRRLNNVMNYSKKIQTYRTNFSIELNKSKLESYKMIIDEYCKIHSINRVNIQQACTEAKALF